MRTWRLWSSAYTDHRQPIIEADLPLVVMNRMTVIYWQMGCSLLSPMKHLFWPSIYSSPILRWTSCDIYIQSWPRICCQIPSLKKETQPSLILYSQLRWTRRYILYMVRVVFVALHHIWPITVQYGFGMNGGSDICIPSHAHLNKIHIFVV